jgi:hypothetical protein
MALAMTFVRLPVHEICAVSDWDGMKKKGNGLRHGASFGGHW